MVYFECDVCNETLKKKQVLPHYSSICRRAHSFSCLTCFNRFDRDSIVAHTNCVTEDEKYQKGDTRAQEMKQKKGNVVHLHHLKDNIEELDFSNIKWKGFNKTAKEIITMINVKKISITRLVDELKIAYSKHKKVSSDEVDTDLIKKHLLDKLEENKEFSIDLSKNTIRLKLNNI